MFVHVPPVELTCAANFTKLAAACRSPRSHLPFSRTKRSTRITPFKSWTWIFLSMTANSTFNMKTTRAVPPRRRNLPPSQCSNTVTTISTTSLWKACRKTFPLFDLLTVAAVVPLLDLSALLLRHPAVLGGVASVLHWALLRVLPLTVARTNLALARQPAPPRRIRVSLAPSAWVAHPLGPTAPANKRASTAIVRVRL